MTLEQEIIRVVTEKNGCKAAEVACHLNPETLMRPDLMADGFIAALDRLVESGEIVSVDYTLPDSEWRGRSFLLPKGSRVFTGV